MYSILPFFTAYKTTVKDILQQAARTGKRFLYHIDFFRTVTLKEIETAYVSVYAAILLRTESYMFSRKLTIVGKF